MGEVKFLIEPGSLYDGELIRRSESCEEPALKVEQVWFCCLSVGHAPINNFNSWSGESSVKIK